VRRPHRIRLRPRPRLFRPPAPEHLRRGIYLLPSLFTVANLFFGFWAIIDAINGNLERAGWLIFLAGMLDGLDGRIARLAHASSNFGREYDSLADVISFGVAPAILAYQWALRDMGRWGLVVGFLFVVAGSVRLARFNVKVEQSDPRYFTGLPIPGGAAAIVMLVLVDPEPVIDPRFKVLVGLYLLLIALLMVSNIPYRTFKEVNLRRRWPATLFFVIAVIVAMIAATPVTTLAVMLCAYLIAGPVEWLLRRLRQRPQRLGADAR
jgi:CDP-diacylglycerol--serine O-phosphatidyltransferase